jgi:hypothetical protein
VDTADQIDSARVRWAACANAALWALGNLLTTGGFLTYFVKGLAPPPTAMTALLVVPETFGLAGLLVPHLLGAGAAHRTIWWVGQVVARSLGLLVPVVALALGESHPSLAAWSIVALVALASVAHSLSFNALMGWLTRLAPGTEWGKLFGRRQLASVLMLLCIAAPVGRLVDYLKVTSGLHPAWIYAPLFALGVACQLLALVPLLRLPVERLAGAPAPQNDFVPFESVTPRSARFRDLWANRPLRQWLVANWWLAAFAGLTQSVFFTLRVDLLAIGLGTYYLLEATLRAAQIPLYEWAGRRSDRGLDRANVQLGCLLTALACAAPILATRETWWLMFVSQLLFAGWAWINVSGPNGLFRLSGDNHRDLAFAWYHNVAGLLAGLTGLAGGLTLTSLRAQGVPLALAVGCLTGLSAAGRLATVWWLSGTDIEPVQAHASTSRDSNSA